MNSDLRSKSSLTFLAVIATLVGLFPTVYASFISNSLALLSDLLRCLAEFLAVLFSWIVLRRIRQKDKAEYNYGFEKFERLASLLIALAMFISFVVLLVLAVGRVQNPVAIENSSVGYFVSSIAVVANASFWLYFLRKNRGLGSSVIESQWKLFRAKTFASLVVVLSLSFPLFFNSSRLAVYSDTTGSILVALFLLYSAYSIVSSSMGDLVDRAIEESLQLEILRTLVEHEKLYSGFHSIRSRRAGTMLYIEICLAFNPLQTMGEVQLSIETILQALSGSIPDSDVRIIAMAG